VNHSTPFLTLTGFPTTEIRINANNFPLPTCLPWNYLTATQYTRAHPQTLFRRTMLFRHLLSLILNTPPIKTFCAAFPGNPQGLYPLTPHPQLPPPFLGFPFFWFVPLPFPVEPKTRMNPHSPFLKRYSHEDTLSSLVIFIYLVNLLVPPPPSPTIFSPQMSIPTHFSFPPFIEFSFVFLKKHMVPILCFKVTNFYHPPRGLIPSIWSAHLQSTVCPCEVNFVWYSPLFFPATLFSGARESLLSHLQCTRLLFFLSSVA